MHELKRAKRLSQALVLFVTPLGSLFAEKRMLSLPIRAKDKYFNTICEHAFDNSPTDSSSSLK